MKKLPNTTSKKNMVSRIVSPIIALVILVGIWQALSVSGVMPSFMMPSPGDTMKAFIKDFDVLVHHGQTTLHEAFLGLLIGVGISFVIAILMDLCKPIKHGLYPLLVVSQTIPSVAIAPILLLWFGYGTLPKIILIVITTFFPITVSLLDGFASTDEDELKLMKSMGAGVIKQYIHIKLPGSLGYFFSGMKIAVSYSIVGAVISEWLGGTRGLGVYMTRTRKSFSYDRMFAVILFIALVSLLLMLIVNIIKWLVMPWERKDNRHE